MGTRVGAELAIRIAAIRLPVAILCREAGLSRHTVSRLSRSNPMSATVAAIEPVLRRHEVATLRHLLTLYDPARLGTEARAQP